jgi:hypothetical protein
MVIAIMKIPLDERFKTRTSVLCGDLIGAPSKFARGTMGSYPSLRGSGLLGNALQPGFLRDDPVQATPQPLCLSWNPQPCR